MGGPEKELGGPQMRAERTSEAVGEKGAEKKNKALYTTSVATKNETMELFPMYGSSKRTDKCCGSSSEGSGRADWSLRVWMCG